jgi:hypothetical protein
VSRPSTVPPQQPLAHGQPEPTANMPNMRIADFATVRERSPFWGITLILGEIAERLRHRQHERGPSVVAAESDAPQPVVAACGRVRVGRGLNSHAPC